MKKIKQIELSDVKTQLALQKALGNIFPVNKDIEAIKENIQNDLVIMDAANICAIVIKNPLMFDIIKPFTFKDKETKKPELKYFSKGETISAKYSSYYMADIYKVFLAIDENPTLFIKKDYPITLKGKYFDFILAPRIDMD